MIELALSFCIVDTFSLHYSQRLRRRGQFFSNSGGEVRLKLLTASATGDDGGECIETRTKRGKHSTRRKLSSVPLCPPTNPTWSDLRPNPGLRGEKSTTNYGTVLLAVTMGGHSGFDLDTRRSQWLCGSR
jgi:hypothetical protein